MNRTDRLLAIVLELQAKKQVRAEDLAATFEVAKRTIYRDMLALMESGVPVVSMPGHGYSLVEGYFLPPLTFNADEAIMLLLGADFAAQNFDAQYRQAAQDARRKILAVLPDQLRTEVEHLANNIRFMATHEPTAPEKLQLLRRAIIQCTRVRFNYHTRSASSQREADPYALIHIAGTWMLVAYCHLRRAVRHFRLDRMEEVELLNKIFTRPADFRLQNSSQADRTIVIKALFDHETARRVPEFPTYYQVAQADHPDGLLVTLLVRQPDDVLNWLLSWGSHVRILEPDAVRDLLIREAQGMLVQHDF